ncbi:bifunctional protein-disulfide isomerase/oxidoreductase DsbC [Aestuariibacter salexigens]|uniref:bifunctional protein-disulfide isomerase/oxidoreductase DsbC n=1 Tax=Aestuariibacter salexigens TaxID=226010 RepID=UPI000419ED17|nr:bifunctional protein-disulfide isomerase/oxidoreductase DsbC [Aestuariibacter salexigens]
MKNIFKSALVATSLVMSLMACAEPSASPVKDKIESTLGLQVSSVADSPVPGLVQVMTDRGMFYASKDGTYFLQARIFNLDEEMRNETEEALGAIRLEGLQQFQDSAVVFKAEDEKYVVNVFTDITCGYCRKFHREIANYNDRGITVRYLAFPRAGLNSKPYNDMVSVWCAEDPLEAMTAAKADEEIASASCKNSVAQQYQFGQRVGVTGTPNIILPDGTLIPGYQPADQLEQALKQVM